MNIGRNDPCPCGSNLKYKKCCLLKDEQVRVDKMITYRSNLHQYLRDSGITDFDRLKSLFETPSANDIDAINDKEFLKWLKQDEELGQKLLKEYEDKLNEQSKTA